MNGSDYSIDNLLCAESHLALGSPDYMFVSHEKEKI
jgi:hypothetical protein